MMPLRRTQFWDELTDISKHAGFEKDFSGLLLKPGHSWQGDIYSYSYDEN